MAQRKTTQQKAVWLSHSGVEEMYRCPRCFWLLYREKIRQPEGITSRLSNRFDILLKKYFNTFREQNELPPIIVGKVEGLLEKPFYEKYFYNHNENFGFWGKLDDCLVHNGKYTPIDHKTTSSDPKNKEETLEAYQHQMNFYALLLEKNNKPTSGIGHLIYYYPQDINDLMNGVPIEVHIETLKTDPAAALKELSRAIEILENPIPQSSENCSFCSWQKRVNDF